MWSTLVAPTNDARFHFGLPDTVQGFLPEDGIKAGSNPILETVTGHSQWGQRSLAFHFLGLVPGLFASLHQFPRALQQSRKQVVCSIFRIGVC